MPVINALNEKINQKHPFQLLTCDPFSLFSFSIMRLSVISKNFIFNIQKVNKKLKKIFFK